MGNTVTKYKNVKVAYEVPTISASHISRLLGQMGSPRQVPIWGTSTTGSMQKRIIDGYDNYWGWEVNKSSTFGSDSKTSLIVRYYRHSEMRSGSTEIEAIRVYLRDLGFEVTEPKYHYTKAWRRDSNGEYQDYEEESSAYVFVSKKVELDEHCETCTCQH